jgi:hypothetical protein
MNWNRFSLFKMPKKYKRFEFTPRYYDERKEALEKKIKAYSNEKGLADASKVRREISFRANAGDRWGNGEYRSKSMRANIRLLIILGVVLGVFFILFTQVNFTSLIQGGK